MRSQAIEQDTLSVLLKALMRENRLALTVSLLTGLRISDVLALKSENLKKDSFVVFEKKTGKKKKIKLPMAIKRELAAIAGHIYIFEGRSSPLKTRTRQTVWKDLRRVTRSFRLKGGASPHSMRKTYAVTLREMGMTSTQIQKALNHSDPCVTALYMYADELALKQ